VKDLPVRLSKFSRILPVFLTLSLFANGQLLLADQLNSSEAQAPAQSADQLDSSEAQTPAQSAVQSNSSEAQAAPETRKTPAAAAEKPSSGKAAVKSANLTPGKLKTPYVSEEPLADPAGSPTRVHRPGQDATLPPLAPPLAAGSPAGAASMPLFNPPPPRPPKERYPSVGQLEQLMFGHSTPNIAVESRLDKLESAIFQRNYNELDNEKRIKRLKEVIIGEDSPHTPYSEPEPRIYTPPATTFPPPGDLGMTVRDLDKDPTPAPLFRNYGHYDLNQQLSISEAEKFAVDVLNEVREQQGANELSWEDRAYSLAAAQVADLLTRDLVSHQNARGENPDLRYTKAGGCDSLVESTIMFPSAENLHPTRQLVVKMLEALFSRQDDREALMYAHASGFAMAFQWSKDRQKLLCCTEVVTKHGQMEALPLEATVGDRIEVKGSISPPYKFQKITLAWEGLTGSPPDDSAELSEALPYFPPLDYEMHAVKSNKDYDKGVKLLQLVGITAAIAGGVFLPPVALAAPLIAATITTPTPKAVSEIPVKGGVKTDGVNFSRTLTLSNQGKEGIYYVTVWANSGVGDESVAVSRRTILAHKGHSSVDSGEGKEAQKSKDSNSDKADMTGDGQGKKGRDHKSTDGSDKDGSDKDRTDKDRTDKDRTDKDRTDKDRTDKGDSNENKVQAGAK
jgi:hypothetical protein